MNSDSRLSTFAFIFARGGSKGLPGKNIKPLAGMPLLAHSIKSAQRCPQIDRVIVSTDDDSIVQVAQQYGAEVPFIRPAELAQDTSSEWLAWQHALNWLRDNDALPDVFVSLPTTAPLRSQADIERCLNALDGDTDMVVTGSPSHRSPWFNMLMRGDDGSWKRVMDGSSFSRRQDVPATYDMTTVAYVSRPEFILNAAGVFDGRVAMVDVPPERAVDIDSELDFKWAEFLLQQDAKV